VLTVTGMLGLPAALGTLLSRFAWRTETRDAGELLLEGRDELSDEHLDATRHSGMDDGKGGAKGL
jgi:hypothetical protein